MKYNESGININTYKLLFHDNQIQKESEYGTIESLNILATIDIYTQILHKNIFEKLLLKINKNFRLNYSQSI